MKTLLEVIAAVLLIVGSLDVPVIELNQQAFDLVRSEKEMEIVTGAVHLFEKPESLMR